jgi:hypothetical protein
MKSVAVAKRDGSPMAAARPALATVSTLRSADRFRPFVRCQTQPAIRLQEPISPRPSSSLIETRPSHVPITIVLGRNLCLLGTVRIDSLRLIAGPILSDTLWLPFEQDSAKWNKKFVN